MDTVNGYIVVSTAGPIRENKSSNCSDRYKELTTPTGKICGGVDTSMCPKIGGDNAIRAFWENNDKNDKTVVCTYNLNSATKSIDSINQWHNNFFTGSRTTPETIKKSENDYNTKILKSYCSGISKNCKVQDIKTGGGIIEQNKPEECSMFFDVGYPGDICRTWANSGASNSSLKTHINEAYNTFCSNAKIQGKDPNECGCINRADDPSYNALVKGEEDLPTGSGGLGNPGCWYGPCIDYTNYLIPYDTISNKNCPSVTICNNIITMYETGNIDIDIDEITRITECNSEDFNKNPDKPSKDVGEDKLKWVIIGVSALIVILLIGALIYYLYGRNKK